ncbi:MAG: esterase family protein [Prevotellaceae bacterium]|jgi:enterochelin esterase-like enzyme|nr:esterase family protein [Prevotellaceae bacterium]
MKRYLHILITILALAVTSGCEDDKKVPSIITGNVAVLSNQTIASSYMSQSMKFNLILPGSYNLEADKSYPVLYLLHGMGGNNTQWITAGNAATWVQQAVKNNVVPELIVVMPDAQVTFYTGNYEQYFQQELIPYIESRYRTINDRGSRFIAGLSMGGYGTLYHALKYPEKFALAFSMSPVDLNGDITRLISQHSGAGLPALTIDAGENDFVVNDHPEKIHLALEAKNIPHEWIYRPGGHDWTFWQASLQTALEQIGVLLN